MSLIGEVILRQLFPSVEDSNRISNSGGTVIFLSPGIRVGLTERTSLATAPEIPVLQDLNDEQQETLFKVVASLVFSFGGKPEPEGREVP